MKTTIILNIIGIAIFYINRYNKRKTESPFSFSFWAKENWPELAITLLFNTGLMILLLHPETNVGEWLTNNLPKGLTVAGKPVTGFLLGFGLAWVFYININAAIEYLNTKIGKWLKQ